MHEDGIDTNEVEKSLREKDFDFAYLIPSYHNPTGIVTSSEKNGIDEVIFKIQRSIIEDGFNEELRYSGSHLAPLLTLRELAIM